MKELTKFNELKAEVMCLVAPVMSVVVSDAETSQKAIDTAVTIKEMSKRIDVLRRELVDPLNDQVKKINAYAKEISHPLDKAETHIRSELNRFAQEQEKIRQEALRKAEEERQKRAEELRLKQEEERALAESGAKIFGGSDTSELEEKHRIEQANQDLDAKGMEFDAQRMNIRNTRKSYEVKIVDLSQVPKEFLIILVNEKAAIAAHKAGAVIPGLSFEEKITVAIGSKTYVPKQMIGG